MFAISYSRDFIKTGEFGNYVLKYNKEPTVHVFYCFLHVYISRNHPLEQVSLHSNGNFYSGETDVNSFGQSDLEVCESFGNGCEADETSGEQQATLE